MVIIIIIIIHYIYIYIQSKLLDIIQVILYLSNCYFISTLLRKLDLKVNSVYSHYASHYDEDTKDTSIYIVNIVYKPLGYGLQVTPRIFTTQHL